MGMRCDSQKARGEAQGRGAGELGLGGPLGARGEHSSNRYPGRRAEGGGGQTHVLRADATQGGEKCLFELGWSGKTTQPHGEERLLTGPSKQAGFLVRLEKGEGTPAGGQARGHVPGQLDAEQGHSGNGPPWTPGPREQLPEETPSEGSGLQGAQERVPLLRWRLWALLNRHRLGSPGVHLQLGAIRSSGR